MYIHLFIDYLFINTSIAHISSYTQSIKQYPIQLQEIRQQLDSLSQTNGYLKAQLRDTKRETEQVVQAERQKSNEELSRVRDAMVTVLDRERRLMKAQIMRTSAEVRAMIQHKNDDGAQAKSDHDRYADGFLEEEEDSHSHYDE